MIDPALLETVRRIGTEVLAPHAGDVDRNARFPHEALAAFKQAKLMSALVPACYGGLELDIADLAEMCRIFGQHCSSAAMVFAMHHIQVACIVRHRGGSAELEEYLRGLVEHQWLIASVTSEVGIGGDTRSSICAIEVTGNRFTLDKKATTISYGANADHMVVTCRRAPDAGPSDQIIVLLRQGDFRLEQTSQWDTLGMRGTCSPGFELKSSGATWQIIPGSYGDASSQTMVPFSHVLWSSLWLGIATEAVSRASKFVRAAARKTPGTIPPMATPLAKLAVKLQTMRANVNDVTATCARLQKSAEGNEAMLSIGFALKMNNLKISCGDMAVEIINDALQICGIMGYKNDTEFSLGRLLRDAHSASLMVSNDRILAKNASLVLVQREL